VLEDLDLAPQAAQLLPFAGRRFAGLPMPVVNLGALDPAAQRPLGDAQVMGKLGEALPVSLR